MAYYGQVLSSSSNADTKVVHKVERANKPMHGLSYHYITTGLESMKNGSKEYKNDTSESKCRTLIINYM